jgi:hypothetical protein
MKPGFPNKKAEEQTDLFRSGVLRAQSLIVLSFCERSSVWSRADICGQSDLT